MIKNKLEKLHNTLIERLEQVRESNKTYFSEYAKGYRDGKAVVLEDIIDEIEILLNKENI